VSFPFVSFPRLLLSTVPAFLHCLSITLISCALVPFPSSIFFLPFSSIYISLFSSLTHSRLYLTAQLHFSLSPFPSLMPRFIFILCNENQPKQTVLFPKTLVDWTPQVYHWLTSWGSTKALAGRPVLVQQRLLLPCKH
jgi:hypothetical protein